MKEQNVEFTLQILQLPALARSKSYDDPASVFKLSNRGKARGGLGRGEIAHKLERDLTEVIKQVLADPGLTKDRGGVS